MSQVLIDTELVHDAAKRVAAAQNTVGTTWKNLATTLTGAKGMAGNPAKDQAAAKFVAAYTPAVRALWRGLATMHRVTGYMSRGLTQTATNHAKADHASMINGRFSMVPRPGNALLNGPAFQVSGPLNLPPPPSAAGPGKASPHSLLGSLTGIELINISRYWPTADPNALATAAIAWKHTHDSPIEARGQLTTDVTTVTGQGQAPDLEAFGGFWKNPTHPKPPTPCTRAYRNCAPVSPKPAAITPTPSTTRNYRPATQRTPSQPSPNSWHYVPRSPKQPPPS